ncbi:MAG: hypothetical protein GY751_15685 [Bacteroidetes bacterium]|nr:hypothetical protein [Bacteroidota bacterium]
MKRFLLSLVVIVCIGTLHSCNDDDDNMLTTTLSASSDGFIVNSTPRLQYDMVLGGGGKAELRTGWNSSGFAMRSFLTFSLSSILPADPSKKIHFDRIVLKIYESNTNLHPFTGDGGQRVVNAFLTDFGTLDINDFNIGTIDFAGIIATNGYIVLKEYPLDVTSVASAWYNLDPDGVNTFQFRLQFSDDDNLANPLTSELTGSMWNIFAEEGTLNSNAYDPVLKISYNIVDR